MKHGPFLRRPTFVERQARDTREARRHDEGVVTTALEGIAGALVALALMLYVLMLPAEVSAAMKLVHVISRLSVFAVLFAALQAGVVVGLRAVRTREQAWRIRLMTLGGSVALVVAEAAGIGVLILSSFPQY